MRHNIVIGWDIGGAHLKSAIVDTAGAVRQVSQQPCPLWKGLSHLHRAVVEVLRMVPRQAGCHAVTMSGELVDLFATRQEGVRQIITVMSEHVPTQHLHVFVGPDGVFKTKVKESDLDGIASANWLASAQLSAGLMGSGLFIDVGSTTTDLLLFDDCRVLTQAYTDFERLKSDELVYTGVVRTPVMTITDRFPFAGEWVAPMAEHFATMSDVYRLCGILPEHADQMPAADGGEKTLEGSARRLARMLGRDMEATSVKSAQQLAEYLREQQLMKLYRGCTRLLSRGLITDAAPLVGAGVGRFLVRALAGRLGRPYRDFASLCVDDGAQNGIDISDCAPAVAVALLLAQHHCS